MNVQDIINMQPALQALANCKLPAKISYRIGKAIGQSKSVLKAYEEKRLAMLREIGTLSEDKKTFNIEGHETEFNEMMEKMLANEVDIKFFPVSLESLGDIKIEPIFLEALDGKLIVGLTVIE